MKGTRKKPRTTAHRVERANHNLPPMPAYISEHFGRLADAHRNLVETEVQIAKVEELFPTPETVAARQRLVALRRALTAEHTAAIVELGLCVRGLLKVQLTLVHGPFGFYASVSEHDPRQYDIGEVVTVGPAGSPPITAFTTATGTIPVKRETDGRARRAHRRHRATLREMRERRGAR